MTDPTPTVRAGEDAGRVAYEARFSHLGPAYFDPWDKLPEEARAVWARVERAQAVCAELEACIRLDVILRAATPSRGVRSGLTRRL
jgi:hypothetical protein